MNPHPHFPQGVSTLDRILWEDRLLLVHWPHHCSRRDKNPSRRRVVLDDVEGNVRLVPARLRADEIHQRNLKLICSAKRAVVRLIDGSGPIVVEKPVRRLDVAVRRVRRRLNRQRRGAALHSRTEDALLRAQIRNTGAAKGETGIKAAAVRDVLPESGLEDGQLAEAGNADVFVAHLRIVSCRRELRRCAARRPPAGAHAGRLRRPPGRPAAAAGTGSRARKRARRGASSGSGRPRPRRCPALPR